MTRKMMGLGLLAGVVGALAVADATFARQDDKLTTADIMKKLNGKTGIHKKVGPTAVQAKDVKWDAIQADTKTYLELAEKFVKLDPPKGDKDKFEKLAKKWAEDVKALNDAAQKKDAKAVGEAHGKIGKSCAGCHKEHKPS